MGLYWHGAGSCLCQRTSTSLAHTQFTLPSGSSQPLSNRRCPSRWRPTSCSCTDRVSTRSLALACQLPSCRRLPDGSAPRVLIDRLGPALLDGIAGQISKRRPDKPAPPRKPNRKKPCHHRAYKLAPVLCCWLIFATVAWRSGMLFDPQRPALTPPAASIPLPPAPSARRTTPTSGRPEC